MQLFKFDVNCFCKDANTSRPRWRSALSPSRPNVKGLKASSIQIAVTRSSRSVGSRRSLSSASSCLVPRDHATTAATRAWASAASTAWRPSASSAGRTKSGSWKFLRRGPRRTSRKWLLYPSRTPGPGSSNSSGYPRAVLWLNQGITFVDELTRQLVRDGTTQSFRA